MDPRVQQTIETMQRRLDRPLRIGELAEAVDLSVAQLTRLFRIDTGTTPGAYLHELRMAKARALVERTSLPVTEVMAHVGLSDRSHFARDFCRAHGQGPRAFRMHLLRRPPSSG